MFDPHETAEPKPVSAPAKSLGVDTALYGSAASVLTQLLGKMLIPLRTQTNLLRSAVDR